MTRHFRDSSTQTSTFVPENNYSRYSPVAESATNVLMYHVKYYGKRVMSQNDTEGGVYEPRNLPMEIDLMKFIPVVFRRRTYLSSHRNSVPLKSGQSHVRQALKRTRVLEEHEVPSA